MPPSPGTAAVLLVVVLACHPSGDLESRPALGAASTSVGPIDGAADVTQGPPAPSAEDKEACAARCDEFIRTRHDACGRQAGPPWPDWCADDNRRTRTDCRLRCGIFE
jgi:hypothetical protein